MEPSADTERVSQKEGIGPVAGILIVVVLMVAGGIYFLFEQNKRFNTPPIQEHFDASSTPSIAS